MIRGLQRMHRSIRTDNIIAHDFRVTLGVKKIKRTNEVETLGQILSSLTEDFGQWMFEWFPIIDFVIYS